MEDTPVAAPQGTEAPQANINPTPAPAAEPAPAPTPEPTQTAPVANIPADQIEAFNRFVGSNGGFESAFAKLKSAVSAPQQPQQPQPQQQQQQQSQQYQPQPQQYQPEPEPEQIPVGYMSQNEYNMQRYYEDLANKEQYASIADELRSGAIFKELSKFGIKPMSKNGAINMKQVGEFLDIYAKSKTPAPAHTAPVTSTPTVDYVNVGEQITSRDDALKVIKQNMTLGNRAANHPQTKAAQEYLKNYFKK